MRKTIAVLTALVLMILPLAALPAFAEEAAETAYDPDTDPLLNAVADRARRKLYIYDGYLREEAGL